MRSRTLFSLFAAGAMALAFAAPVAAHPHTASNAHGGTGQEIANGQNHGPLLAGGVRCGGDPAAYGLETAHHGPDAGTPGKADDACYTIAETDRNPGIN